MTIQFIKPDWPAPANVHACTTSRKGGVSGLPYQELNLGDHVGDNETHVNQNRMLVKQQLSLVTDPVWFSQVHGTVALPALPENQQQTADAAFASKPHQICAMLTADCLPVLLCNHQGTHVAAIHAGWRGLLNGVIESTINSLNIPTNEILAWLGPAIGPCHFEVGAEVREQFINKNVEAETAFSPSPNQRWLANLYELATLRLHKQGIHQIYGGEYCTYCDPIRFYSYRRDGEKTGRMASLIWLTD